MSEGTGLLLAVALSILFFSLLLWLFKENHPLLRLVFIMGVMVSGFFIPTGVYQLQQNCNVVVANSTTAGSTISYEYTSFCYTTTTTAPNTFYIVMWTLYQIFIIYLIVYVLILMFKPVVERVKRW